jgi:hypothetical protein
MFEEYYQLSKTPFSRDIPTESLYQSHMLEEILGRLEYAAKRQLFAVVTGDFSHIHPPGHDLSEVIYIVDQSAAGWRHRIEVLIYPIIHSGQPKSKP